MHNIDDKLSLQLVYLLCPNKLNKSTPEHSWHLSWVILWANILNGSTWLKCNDKSVMPIKPDALNNRDSYVLFYIQS